MNKKLLMFLSIAILAVGSAGCASEGASGSANTNTNATVASDTTRPGPDGSEITTSTDATGVKTETRIFHNNARVSKVVVITRDGKRTTTVYSTKGESRDLKDEVGDGLSATGDAIADGAGWVADKSEDVADKTKEGAKAVGEKTAEGAKTVGEKTAEGAKTVRDKTVEGAKTVGEKTASGAKKTGKAIKKIIP